MFGATRQLALLQSAGSASHLAGGLAHALLHVSAEKRHLCTDAVGIGGGRDGAFAEYLVMPAANLWPVHDDIPSDTAAILDPFGNAVHCALSFDVTAEDVLVTGAGPIGIMAAAVCRFIGARHVVISDINPYRLALAEKLGIRHTVNAAQQDFSQIMQSLKMSNGFDVALEMSGSHEAFNALLDAMYHGGYVALLGFLPPQTEINWDTVIFKGLHLKGVYGREVFDTWYKMTQLLRSGLDISPIITHRYPVNEYEEAFEVVHSGECGKVILDWVDRP